VGISSSTPKLMTTDKLAPVRPSPVFSSQLVVLISLEETESIHVASVVMCTGLHVVPSVPSIPGIEHVGASSSSSDKKRAFHSVEYKNRAQVAGRRVMVLGTGETGMDIVRHPCNYNTPAHSSRSIGLRERKSWCKGGRAVLTWWLPLLPKSFGALGSVSHALVIDHDTRTTLLSSASSSSLLHHYPSTRLLQILEKVHMWSVDLADFCRECEMVTSVQHPWVASSHLRWL